MNKITKIIIGIIVIALVVIVWLNMSSNKFVGNTIKIGVLTPLTGSVAEYGNNVKQGILLATKEINNANGINGKKIELFFEDSKCDSTEAVNSFNKLVNIDGAGIILGTVCSSETLAIAPLANEKKVIVVSAAASSPQITNAGDYIFRVYPSDDYEAGVAASTIFSKFQKNKVSVLYLNNDYGVALRDAFRKKFTALGGKILNEEGYVQGATDFRTQLLKVKDQKPDVIYMISYPVDGGLAIKQAKQLVIKAIYFGTSGLKGNDFISNGGISTEGFVLASPIESSSTKTDTFTKNYETEFGVKPGIASDRAYDSVYVIKAAFIEAKNITDIKNNLYKINQFDGASGGISFDSNGDLANIKYSLFDIKNSKFVKY